MKGSVNFCEINNKEKARILNFCTLKINDIF